MPRTDHSSPRPSIVTIHSEQGNLRNDTVITTFKVKNTCAFLFSYKILYGYIKLRYFIPKHV